MIRRSPMLPLALLAVLGVPVWAAQRINVLKLAITNPGQDLRPAENIVIPLGDLKRIAPGFTPASVVVTYTEASHLGDDAKAMETTGLPVQADDTDGDGKLDELAFQVPLKPGQTRIVTIAYGASAVMAPLQMNYPSRAAAKYAAKYEGPGWESDATAWRIYLDKRNAIDVFGKRRPGLYLDMFAAPEYQYHDETPLARDIYKIGGALGIGAIGALVDGKPVAVSDVAERKWRVIASGPVRAIVEVSYKDWKAGGRTVQLVSRFTQWAGERGFEHSISTRNADGLILVTALPAKPGAPVIAPAVAPGVTATWGHQVVEPGVTGVKDLPDQNLGLAVIVPGAGEGRPADPNNHLVPLVLNDGAARWYVTAAWDQEQSSDLRVFTQKPARLLHGGSIVIPSSAIRTREQFRDYVAGLQARLANPAAVRILSQAPGTQSAPPDTLAPARSKTIPEAIELLRTAVDRTAAAWEEAAKGGKNAGFFTEGNNETGEWQKQHGFFWTGSFWVGEIWKLYGLTKDEKYRRWGDRWNQNMVGLESDQNHDTGFLNYYSSAFGCDLTGHEEYCAGAMRAAERLKQLFNPTTGLVAAWSVNGDDTIVDTMMNLNIWWWASKHTGDPGWRELGRKHALKTAEWLIRADGSVIQSVHYNPGDNRQRFRSGGDEIRYANSVPPGGLVFEHTHQGYAANTTWSRGAAWALYGFSLAAKETRDPKLLETAEHVADFVLDRLPEDLVPWYDYDDEGVRFRNRDTSAAALNAGGLLHLAGIEPDAARATRYRTEARRIVQSVIDRYLTPVAAGDKTPGGVLRHGSSTRPSDTPLIYGDYYLLEVLLRLNAE